MTSSYSQARPRALALALACAFALPSVAQDTLPTVEITGAAPRAGLLDLDTPVDTGSRLGLSSRETPASVNVVDRATIELRGAQDTQDILRALPGVTAHNAPGNIGVFYRGFGSGSISQLFNGINVQYTIAARPVDSWIYERVESIGGPSGFMSGAGAVGGTINYITKTAERREFGEAQLRVGAEGLREASFGLNRRVDDTHYTRIDLNHRDSDSWIEGSGSRSTQLAASLRSDFTQAFTHTLAYEYQEEDVDRPYWGTPLLNPVAGRARIDQGTRIKNYNSLDGVYDQRVHWLRSVTQYKPASGAQWTNTLYAYDALRDYRNVETYRFNPGNTAVIRSGILLQRHDQRVVGNRLDGSRRGTLLGRRSDWAYGLDINYNRQTRFPNSLSGTVGAVDPYRFTPEHFFDLPGMAPGFRPDRDNRVRTLAAYLENRTALAPSVHLVTALRHERIELELTNRREVTSANPASFERRYRPTTGRAGLVWDLTPTAMLYAQYATAADPPSGVLSTASFADVRNNSELTRGRQGEIGAKLTFWDGKGSATLAAYDISRRNIATQDPNNSALTMLVGEQTARGVELAVGLQPTRQWSIQGNLTKAEARYANFRQSGVSLAGKTPTNTPETVANLWLGWEPVAGVKASVGLRHVGHIYADAANTVDWPAYTLVDLALSVKLRPDLLLTGRVRNAGDRIYAANMAATMAYLGAPRSAEVALRYTF